VDEASLYCAFEEVKDGKTLRGTLAHASSRQPAVHLLSLYDCESGSVLAKEPMKSEKDEVIASEVFLHTLLTKGRIISVDDVYT
jgi:hypothetical protein